jgi:hypothetical protein
MADYYPLIVKAVAGLHNNTGEIRRALYDRARTALVGQLRSIEPPLNEGDITRERVALEEAIRKVETEASKRKPDAPEDGKPSLTDEGLRGFRAVVAEAETLGDATAEANRAAHEVDEAIPSDRPPAEEQAMLEGAYELPLEFAAPAPAAPSTPLHEPTVAGENAETAEEPAIEAVAESHLQPAASVPHAEPVVEESLPVRRHVLGRIIKVLLLVVVVGGISGGLYWQRHEITNLIATFRKASAPQKQAAQQSAPKPKIADRVGAGGAPAPANAPAASVAQKVVLYDEDPSNPQGKRYVGSAIWRTETVSPGPGLAPELAIRADVEIPERHMRMTFSLRRNTDKALPASHTIEIMFTVPQDFSEGGINNVPGVLMKQEEQARGAPLAGLAVKVTTGYFLIGLSAVEVDMQRNIDMLKNRDWFDVPLVYTTGKRAILAMEKGDAGKRVFEEAFRAWGE